MQQIAHHLLLGLLGGHGGAVAMGAVGIIAEDETFLRHDLHEFENGGISQGRITRLVDDGHHIANRGGMPLPKGSQNGHFRLRGPG